MIDTSILTRPPDTGNYTWDFERTLGKSIADHPKWIAACDERDVLIAERDAEIARLRVLIDEAVELLGAPFAVGDLIPGNIADALAILAGDAEVEGGGS